MKFETTFLGKYFYIGNYKGKAAATMESELEALKNRVKAQALDMFEDQLDALVNNKTAPARPAGPPARPKMPRWMVLSEHVQVTEGAPPVSYPVKIQKDGTVTFDGVKANIMDCCPLKWSEKTPDRLYIIPNRALHVAADEFKAFLDGTLHETPVAAPPVRRRRAPVEDKAPPARKRIVAKMQEGMLSWLPKDTEMREDIELVDFCSFDRKTGEVEVFGAVEQYDTIWVPKYCEEIYFANPDTKEVLFAISRNDYNTYITQKDWPVVDGVKINPILMGLPRPKILELDDVRVDIPSRKGVFTAADGRSYDLSTCDLVNDPYNGNSPHPWVTIYNEEGDFIGKGCMINEKNKR